MALSHQSIFPRTSSMPHFSGASPSLAGASTLTMSLSYSVSSASCHACLRTNSTTFCATSSVFISPPYLDYFPQNFSSLSRTLFQPSVWRSRDSSLGSCSCVSRTSVPPSQSDNSTVTTLSRCSQSSSSSHRQVKTIFLPGCSSQYSPRIVISSPSGLVSSQENFPPTRVSATILRV